jgi:hypothetical protein
MIIWVIRQKSKRSCQYIIAHQSDKLEGKTEAEFKNLHFQYTQANKLSGITSI